MILSHFRSVPARRSRSAAAALALALLAACGGGEGGEPAAAADEAPLPTGITRLARDAALAVPRQSDPRCRPRSVRTSLRSQAEWDAFWASRFDGCPVPPLPRGVDFRRDMLVFAAMGPRRSATDDIAIVGSGVQDDRVAVVLRRTTRQDGCPPGSEEVWPATLVRIPHDPRPVRFLEEHRKLPCE